MKKIIFFTVLIMIVCLIGCQASKNSEVTFYQDDYKITMDLYELQFIEDGRPVVFDIDSISEETEPFHRLFAKNKRTFNVLGKEYDGIYYDSYALDFCDTVVDAYEIKDRDFGKIMVDSATGKIIKYHMMPWEKLPESEAEGIEFVKSILDNEYDCDLASYDYKCKTHYYSTSSKGISSKVEEGFVGVGATDEMIEIRGYAFYFEKRINGLTTSDHISAEFYYTFDDEPNFILEVYNSGYTEKDFKKIIDAMPAIEEKIPEFISEKLKKEYELKEIKKAVNQEILFIKDEQQYLLTNVEFECKDVDYTLSQQLLIRVNN